MPRGTKQNVQRHPSLFRNFSWVAPKSRYAEWQQYQRAWMWAMFLFAGSIILGIAYLLSRIGVGGSTSLQAGVFFFHIVAVVLGYYVSTLQTEAGQGAFAMIIASAVIMRLVNLGSDVVLRDRILHQWPFPKGCSDALNLDYVFIEEFRGLACSVIEYRLNGCIFFSGACVGLLLVAFGMAVAACVYYHRWTVARTDESGIANRKAGVPAQINVAPAARQDLPHQNNNYQQQQPMPDIEMGQRRQQQRYPSGDFSFDEAYTTVDPEIVRRGNPITAEQLVHVEFAQDPYEGREEPPSSSRR